MSVAFFLARKLSLSSSGRKSSPAVRVAVAAVALSIAVMMCAIAVVLGFKGEITEKVAGFNSQMSLLIHLQATPDSESSVTTTDNIITLTPSLEKILDEQPFIADYALQTSIPAIFKTSSDFKGVYLKSLTGSDARNFIASSLEEGSIPDYSSDSTANQIVISRRAADNLNLAVGDRIDTYFISDQVRVRPLRIAGIFNSHFENYDDSFAYASLPLIQQLGNLSPNQSTSIAIATTDFSRVDEYADALSDRLIRDYSTGVIYKLYRVQTAHNSGASYFQWLRLLDMNVIVILTLMTIVACVTLVSGMLILMVDKIRFIALMSALGASRNQIGRVFMLMAAKIALIGMAIGDFLSLAIIIVQQKTHVMPLDPESYYIDFVPMKLSWIAFAILNAAIFAIIWLILIIPSRFAGKAAPARTLAAD